MDDDKVGISKALDMVIRAKFHASRVRLGLVDDDGQIEKYEAMRSDFLSSVTWREGHETMDRRLLENDAERLRITVRDNLIGPDGSVHAGGTVVEKITTGLRPIVVVKFFSLDPKKSSEAFELFFTAKDGDISFISDHKGRDVPSRVSSAEFFFIFRALIRFVPEDQCVGYLRATLPLCPAIYAMQIEHDWTIPSVYRDTARRAAEIGAPTP